MSSKSDDHRGGGTGGDFEMSATTSPTEYERHDRVTAAASSAWWRPGAWQMRTWAICISMGVAIVIFGVITGFGVEKAARYPDYSKINYSLNSGPNFFDKFDYFTGYDPTAGFVHYVPGDRAMALNLTYASASSAYLKVDTYIGNTSTPDASTGRFSVRVTSKTQYNQGLFLFDVKHTPHGCGTWPALWLTDVDNWPAHGEIDVMEAVNKAETGNQMTLHTTNDCAMNFKRKMTGSALSRNCFNGTDDNAGCGVSDGDASFGAGYNSAGGGIMAMEWRKAGIRVWSFPRDAITSDITSKKPDPSTWTTPVADFPETECDIGRHFRNQSIILNIDLCGSLAGRLYEDSGCPSDCQDFVANNPQAFTDAYWEIGSFEVYQPS